jgi:putative transposase
VAVPSYQTLCVLYGAKAARVLRPRRLAMGYPHRLDAQEYSGYRLYFLTIGTFRRARHFADPTVVETAQSHFLRTAVTEGYAVLAYCFMPDHLHMVVAGSRESADFRRFVSAAKQAAGFAFARTQGVRLWQSNFFDRTIRRSDDLAAIMAYMLNNPVRAGMVDEPVHYAHWGSQLYARDELLAFVGTARRRP